MSPNDAEREVLARIRGASYRDSAEEIAAELEGLRRPGAAPLPAKDLCEALQINLQRNGASSQEVATRRDAVLEISKSIAQKHRQRRIVTGHDARLAALPWRDGGLLPRFDAAQPGDAVSVSYAYCAVAESGSLALFLDRNNPGLNNLLVEDHIILVDRGDICERLEGIWTEPRLKQCETRPRGLMMISGPSSTADIAMQLVLGAHGPRSLHVIILGDSSQTNA